MLNPLVTFRKDFLKVRSLSLPFLRFFSELLFYSQR
jgi:hypothetical protein